MLFFYFQEANSLLWHVDPPDLLEAESGLDFLVAENYHRKTSRRSLPLIPGYDLI